MCSKYPTYSRRLYIEQVSWTVDTAMRQRRDFFDLLSQRYWYLQRISWPEEWARRGSYNGVGSKKTASIWYRQLRLFHCFVYRDDLSLLAYPDRIDWLIHGAFLMNRLKFGLLPIGLGFLIVIVVIWFIRKRPGPIGENRVSNVSVSVFAWLLSNKFCILFLF